MKRFWLEEQWHWSTTARMFPLSVPAINPRYLFIIFVFIQFVPSSFTVGESCLHKLSVCSEHEVCVQVNSTTGLCECEDSFKLNNSTGKCEQPKPPPEPSGNHLGLGLGLGITFFVLLVVAVLGLLHRKFHIFSNMCDRLPTLRPFGIRSGDIIMVDNDDDDDDDVNPIV